MGGQTHLKTVHFGLKDGFNRVIPSKSELNKEWTMKYSALFFFALLSALSQQSFAEDIFVLHCELQHPVQTVTGFDLYGDSETWPKLAAGTGVSAMGSAKEHLTDGSIYVAQGTYMSDSAGINFMMMMVGKTYANFDFKLDTQNQNIHVINRWDGDWEDYDMTCGTSPKDPLINNFPGIE